MTVRILRGDVRDRLQDLPDESVHCVVTSPPYWGLRDYGVEGQLGLEATPEAYIEAMVAVFRDVHRVLRADGTLWLNIGDSYAGNRGYQVPDSKHRDVGNAKGMTASRRRDDEVIPRSDILVHGCKPKDLVGIPWMLAFALRAEGWYLRQDIIWAKPNPMPESVTDRCTKAHEYLFLLSKSQRYYYDVEAILEPVSPNTNARLAQDIEKQIGSARANGGTRPDRPMKTVRRKLAGAGSGTKNNTSFDDAMAVMPVMRNKRSVWTVNTEAFSEAHFATFPTKLIEPCILAGSPEGGTVLDPFGGAGTTGLVADRNHRDAILIELNPRLRRHGGAPDLRRIAALREGGHVIRRRDLIAGVRATPEDEELIQFRGKPNEALLRFRHNAAGGAPGPFRRVKVTWDVIDDALARCAKEFG